LVRDSRLEVGSGGGRGGAVVDVLMYGREGGKGY